MPTEKYSNPGLYLDEDDHGRLIEENRAAYIRDEAERKSADLHDLKQARDVAQTQTAINALEAEITRLEDRLDTLHEMMEDER